MISDDLDWMSGENLWIIENCKILNIHIKRQDFGVQGFNEFVKANFIYKQIHIYKIFAQEFS